MTTTLHNLRGSLRRRVKRVGRGNSSGRGTYSGRGIKGQRARSGGRRGIQRRALKSFYQRIPKVKGFNSPQAAARILTLGELERLFHGRDTIRIKDFRDHGLLTDTTRRIRVLSGGTLTRKLIVFAHGFSASAKEAIEKLGGTATLVTAEKKNKEQKKPERMKGG